MKLFLDTTIQIDRIFGSSKRRNAIRAVCQGRECCCSSYVLGEFNSNIMLDVVFVYHTLLQENDLNEAERRVEELARGRRQNRAHMIFVHLRELYDNNLEEIKCELESYLEDLQSLFFRGIDGDLSDFTRCQRARAYLRYEDGVPVWEGCSCRKERCVCNIVPFWESHRDLLDAPFPSGLEERAEALLNRVRQSDYDVKGNNCRSLGDAVIVLEARDAGGEICSTNRKDFAPLCKLFQVRLNVPNYA